MPWKNGKGTTTEIVIYPPHSSIEINNFTWRLSSAQVCESGTFSLFPNCVRQLTVLSGHGLRLGIEGKDEIITAGSILEFSGEGIVNCDLIDGPVTDLNLIFKKSGCRPEFKINSGPIDLPNVTNIKILIFVILGSLEIKITNETLNLSSFETAILEIESSENKSITVLSGENTSYALIKIRDANS